MVTITVDSIQEAKGVASEAVTYGGADLIVVGRGTLSTAQRLDANDFGLKSLTAVHITPQSQNYQAWGSVVNKGTWANYASVKMASVGLGGGQTAVLATAAGSAVSCVFYAYGF